MILSFATCGALNRLLRQTGNGQMQDALTCSAEGKVEENKTCRTSRWSIRRKSCAPGLFCNKENKCIKCGQPNVVETFEAGKTDCLNYPCQHGYACRSMSSSNPKRRSCLKEGQNCGEGRQTREGLCRIVKKLNEECDFPTICDSGLICKYVGKKGETRCLPKPACATVEDASLKKEGDTCEFPTKTHNCGKGLYCTVDRTDWTLRCKKCIEGYKIAQFDTPGDCRGVPCQDGYECRVSESQSACIKKGPSCEKNQKLENDRCYNIVRPYKECDFTSRCEYSDKYPFYECISGICDQIPLKMPEPKW